MKKEGTGIIMFKEIKTFSNKIIVLTGEHSIYARETSLDKYHPM